LFRKVTTEERLINNQSSVFPTSFISNKMDNRKYNFLTFLPLVFFYQFRHFLNLFFLIIALSQFYEPVKVGFLLPKIMPVCIILAVSFFKELWDELQRVKKDKAVNNELYM
jgi:phospholipid-translocating ATPase